jgi:hypothetical protein
MTTDGLSTGSDNSFDTDDVVRCVKPTAGTTEEIYTDEIFIQMGSGAHVEIGNNSTYLSCTHRELQVPSIWTGTSITVDITQGSLEDGSYWLFVVDENGDVSNGLPITIGAGAAVTPTVTGATLGAGVSIN